MHRAYFTLSGYKVTAFGGMSKVFCKKNVRKDLFSSIFPSFPLFLSIPDVAFAYFEV